MQILPIPKSWRRLSLALIAALSVDNAYAEKPHHRSGNQHNRRQHPENHGSYDDRATDGQNYFGWPNQHYFNDQHRLIINQYYSDQLRSGHCPPGLQKKRNGCLPPGQARKWRVGQRLPRDVLYYEVPASIIGPAPAGYRFIRVASDILMIAIGSGMVIDALTDLNGM